ncbi:MAG: hypothetical protein CMJ52_00040 [Planctomycetaceae bacterium]|nr:hypothetical protein [Planctomycetaceae bacterium]
MKASGESAQVRRDSRIRRIFDEALSIAPDQRLERIRESCDGDEDLLRSVVDLLGEVAEEIEDFQASRFDHPRVGTTIRSGSGSWHLQELIGEGGGSAVFRATWSDDENPWSVDEVAVKILKDRHDTPGLVARFQTEILTLRRLEHPGIVQVIDSSFDHATEEGTPAWFAMHLVDDPRWITDRTLNFEPMDGSATTTGRIDLVAEACDAIAQAHSKGVVHRDLKPSNLLVGSDGNVRVIDFGVAHLQPGHPRSGLHGTMEGNLIGTPAYMAPEQVDASLGRVSPRTDVYALGVIAFRMIAGQPPYEVGENLLAAIQAIRHVPPRDLRRLSPDTNESMVFVIERALSKNPEHRQRDASVLARDLRRAQSSDSIPPDAPSRSRFLAPSLAFLPIALLAALAGFLGMFDRGESIDSRPTLVVVPDDASSIQSAVDLVAEGGTIRVRPGTYEENILIERGRHFTIESTHGPDVTIVRSNGEGRSVLEVGNGIDRRTRIEGMTFSGGSTGTRSPNGFWVGGGVYLRNNAVNLVNCVLEGNRSTFGGNLYTMNFRGRLERCVLINGRADAEAGNAFFFRGEAEIVDCRFIGGVTTGDGGGIKTVGGFNAFRGCAFIGNQSDRGGGIMHVDIEPECSRLLVESSLIAGNRAFEGGGIWSRSTQQPPLMPGTSIRANRTEDVGGPFARSIVSSTPECWRDLDGNDTVDRSDLEILLTHLGPVRSAWDGVVDLDGSGIIGPHDLTILIEGWGRCLE